MARRAAAVTRAIMESSPDCIITVDGGRVVTDWNPAAERTFGRSRGELPRSASRWPR